MNTNKRPIAITSGDLRGIGPEVIAKGLFKLRLQFPSTSFVVFGEPEAYFPFKKYLPTIWRVWNEEDFFLESPKKLEHAFHLISLKTRKTKKLNLDFACGRSIELATLGVMDNHFKALVTGPIDKNALQRGGYDFNGHTDFIEHLCNNTIAQKKKFKVTMMMASPQMRVSLVTTHIGISEISSKLSTDKVVLTIENTIQSLQSFFGISNPKIAVLGLNPHAGDQGLFGKEEKTVIAPAIKAIRKHHPEISIDGPFPPDGFFAQWKTRHQKKYDAIICMYHDQGLIPIKLLDFENAVNVSLGLPLIRTSVDHGVGYDIVGTNTANPSSFCAALLLAEKMSKNLKRKK